MASSNRCTCDFVAHLIARQARLVRRHSQKFIIARFSPIPAQLRGHRTGVIEPNRK